MTARPNRKVPCPECEAPIRPHSRSCRSCYEAERTRRSEARRICSECGGLRSEPNGQRCLACTFRLRREASPACRDCGKQPLSTGAERCRPCRLAADRDRTATVGLLPRFNAAAFRDLLTREDLEWTAAGLAAESGVTDKTIRSWLNGSQRPRTFEWRQVAAVLALKACAHCGGSGTVDPTAESIAVVSRAVQVSGVALPAPEPLITGDGWTLDRNSLTLTIGRVGILVTRQEARLLAVLADAGRFVSTAQIGAVLGISNHAVHTYLTRLRDKCVAAGVDLGRVVQNGRGAGYRCVMAERAEAVS